MKPLHVYTENSKEFIKAFEELQWPHDTSTPYRSETHGVAERAVRRVKEGTASALAQSGLSEEWWGAAMCCYCYLRNIVDKIAADGKTPYERRFGEAFFWPCYPVWG